MYYYRQSIVFLILFLFCTLTITAQNLNPNTELKGITFLTPTIYQTEKTESLVSVQTNYDQCRFHFYRGERDNPFFSENSLNKFYENYVKGLISNYPEAVISKQEYVYSREFKGLKSEILFIRGDGNESLIHYILFVDDTYYTFQENRDEDVSCSEDYNLDVIIESIKIKNASWKGQVTDRSDYITGIIWGTSFIILTIAAIIAGITYLILFLF